MFWKYIILCPGGLSHSIHVKPTHLALDNINTKRSERQLIKESLKYVFLKVKIALTISVKVASISDWQEDASVGNDIARSMRLAVF